MMQILMDGLTNIVFVFTLSYYFMSAMQWYSYKLERVFFHYNRYDWHVYFFIIPLFLYYITKGVLALGLTFLYGTLVFLWNRRIDKKLVFTARIKRFFLFLTLALLFQSLLCLSFHSCYKLGVLMPLIIAHLFSIAFERILFESFKKTARQKLLQNPTLKIVAITASYGKTSIKNILAHLLDSTYRVYKTPRSVNTIGGIVKDINDALPQACDVYIVEAGARLKGDIDEIARFVNPHIAVVGCIGPQHIEYFKTLENIRNTKMELLHSSRLEKAFVHESANAIGNDRITIFGSELHDIRATLDGLTFCMDIDGKSESFTCKLLGAFNAINIAAAIHVAHALGLNSETIRKNVATLQGVEHRLQRIEAGGKLIIDDSFNGNLEGMLSSYDLVATHPGRKVVITPGIVESTPEANIMLAQKIDSIFDLVIITGKTNAKILDEHILKAEKIILSDKSKLQETLAEHTFVGDVILFSNDAPSFI